MAIVCKKWKLLFVMVGGTGCSSVGEALLSHLNGQYLPEENVFDGSKMVFGRKHNSVPQLLERGYLKQEELKDLTVFATVRNPFDHVASDYARAATDWSGRFLRDKNGNPIERSEDEILAEKTRAEAVREGGFEKWVLRRYSLKARLKSQIRILLGRSKSVDMYGYVQKYVRFEELEDGLNRLLNEVGYAGWVHLDNVNPTSGRKPYREYYTPRSRKIIERYHRKELDQFGYQFD